MRLGIIMTVLLISSWAYAETVPVEVSGPTWDKHYGHTHDRTVYSEGEVTVHDKTIDTVEKKHSEIGAGVDILIHETENIDVVAEYKYDWENDNHSAYTVFKTKKSLVDYIKALFGN